MRADGQGSIYGVLFVPQGKRKQVFFWLVQRYARVLGYRVQYHLIPEGQAKADPPVVVHHAS